MSFKSIIPINHPSSNR